MVCIMIYRDSSWGYSSLAPMQQFVNYSYRLTIFILLIAYLLTHMFLPDNLLSHQMSYQRRKVEY